MAGSFMAVLSFGLVLEMPRKYLGWSGHDRQACAGWYIMLVKAGTGSMILGAFLSSLSVALMGHLFARIFRAPVSVFLVPGILPLVPGTSIYNSVYYVIRNSREESMYYLVETLQIAGAIALAVFLMDSVFKLVGKKKRIKV
ncbi:MAG: threonine/serine exporter family protein [Enterocloster sp.]